MTHSLRHTFARNTAFLFLAQVATRILGFFAGILLANYLDVEKFGIYNFAIAFGGLLIPFTDVGVDTAFVKDNAGSENYGLSLSGTLLFVKLVLGIVVVAISMTLVPNLVEPDKVFFVRWGIVVTVVRTYVSSFSAMVRSQQRMEIDSHIQVALKVFEVAAIFVAFLFHASIKQLLVLLFVFSVLQVVYSAGLLLRNGFFIDMHIERSKIKAMIISGLPYALSGISIALYFQINTVFLQYAADDKAVGMYRSASNLILPFTAFSTSIAIALFPMIAKLNKERPTEAVHLASDSIFYSLLLSLPLAVGGTIIAQPLIELLYKESYANAVLTLQICIWWLPVVFVALVMNHVLGAINLQRYVLVITLFNVVFNILANLLLVPLFADKGAAVTTVLTEGVGLVLSSIVVTKFFGHVYDYRRIARLVVANAVMFVLLFLVKRMNVFLLIGGGALIYVLMLIVLKVVTRDEFSKLLKVFKKPATVQSIPHG